MIIKCTKDNKPSLTLENNRNKKISRINFNERKNNKIKSVLQQNKKDTFNKT